MSMQGGGGYGTAAVSSGAMASPSGGSGGTFPLWEMEWPDVYGWLRTVPALSSSALQQQIAAAAAAAVAAGQQQQQPAAVSVRSIQQWLFKNLEASLRSVQVEVKEEEYPRRKDIGGGGKKQQQPPSRCGNGETDGAGRPKKRAKMKKTILILHDPYHVFLHAVAADKEEKKNPSFVLDDEADEVPATVGGKLAKLTVGGLINALCCQSGGVVHKTSPGEKIAANTVPPAPLPMSFRAVYQVSQQLHRAIQVRVRTDILTTTPIRIRDMLAPELQPHEFAAVRKRIYDTVILGKGIHTAEEDESDALPTATQSVHDIERMKKCTNCGNNDQSSFVLDRKNGDVICSTCGTIVSESIMHEGSQYRKFEGEADRNHHGDAANPLYSNAHNMSTTLSGVAPTTGAGQAGWGSGNMSGGGKRNLETILRNAHAYTELNVSQFGKNDRRTRIGYKDKQKKDAFLQMTHVGDTLSLHEAVVQRAKELFAGFRDDRELVQQKKAVIAACLCEAFEQLSTAGRAILKQEANQDAAAAEEETKPDQRSSASSQDPAKAKKQAGAFKLSARATRRNELHNATLAGKGGLLLDFSNLTENGVTGGEAVPGTAGATGTADAPSAAAGAAAAGSNAPSNDGEDASDDVATKPAAAWDLEDCRSWLLEASRKIAQEWVEQDRTGGGKNIPVGSQEELEGQLVEHSITLCEHLEGELKARARQKQAAASSRKRVVTPRVQDMSKLGIRWQHKHERGSGGKGGVGGSGAGKNKVLPPAAAGKKSAAFTAAKAAAAAASGLTAGQVLILKTAKKLGSVLKDEVAGQAIHRELRAVIAKQEERKRLQMRQEATRQRLQQMKRKPWLTARVTQQQGEAQPHQQPKVS